MEATQKPRGGPTGPGQLHVSHPTRHGQRLPEQDPRLTSQGSREGPLPHAAEAGTSQRRRPLRVVRRLPICPSECGLLRDALLVPREVVAELWLSHLSPCQVTEKIKVRFTPGHYLTACLKSVPCPTPRGQAPQLMPWGPWRGLGRWPACPHVILVTRGLGWSAGGLPGRRREEKQGLGLCCIGPAAPVRPGRVSLREQHHRENRPHSGRSDVSLSALRCWASGGPCDVPLSRTLAQARRAPGKAALPHMPEAGTSQHRRQLRAETAAGPGGRLPVNWPPHTCPLPGQSLAPGPGWPTGGGGPEALVGSWVPNGQPTRQNPNSLQEWQGQGASLWDCGWHAFSCCKWPQHWGGNTLRATSPRDLPGASVLRRPERVPEGRLERLLQTES